MVGMLKRMRSLKERVRPGSSSRKDTRRLTVPAQLLDIRLGPGALVMAPDVQRIHLSFARKQNDGHLGPRKFWRLYLPRLKYHNPAVPMTIARSDDQAGPATMTVSFADLASVPEDAEPHTRVTTAQTARTETIEMKHRHERDILADFTQMVSGRQVEATPEEKEELGTLREARQRSERDAVLQKEVVRKRRREQEVLEQARRSVEAQAQGV